MRIIQVGTGNFGLSWRQAIASRGLTVAAIVDANPEALQEARQHYGLEPTSCFLPTEPWEKIDADFIIDSSPHNYHLANARRAMSHDKGVVCVKPMCSTWHDSRELLALSQQTGCKVAVAQQLRYHPKIMKLREIIQSGSLGAIGYIHLDTPAEKSGLLGTFHTTFGDKYPALIGGSIHALDYLRWVLGADADGVYGESFNPPWIKNKELYCAYAIYHMSNEAKVCYRLYATDEESTDKWLSDWHIEGSNGLLTMLRGNIRLNGEPVEPDTGPSDLASLNNVMLGEYIQWLQGGAEPGISAAHNMNSLAMLFGLIQSSETGKRIDLRTF